VALRPRLTASLPVRCLWTYPSAVLGGATKTRILRCAHIPNEARGDLLQVICTFFRRSHDFVPSALVNGYWLSSGNGAYWAMDCDGADTLVW
jgi:hypothetical protein